MLCASVFVVVWPQKGFPSNIFHFLFAIDRYRKRPGRICRAHEYWILELTIEKHGESGQKKIVATLIDQMQWIDKMCPPFSDSEFDSKIAIAMLWLFKRMGLLQFYFFYLFLVFVYCLPLMVDYKSIPIEEHTFVKWVGWDKCVQNKWESDGSDPCRI